MGGGGRRSRNRKNKNKKKRHHSKTFDSTTSVLDSGGRSREGDKGGVIGSFILSASLAVFTWRGHWI